jgi:hypothetical protein
VTAPDKDAIQGHWIHAHEEDSESELVFRPAGDPLPPSRGRISFDLRPDGSFSERSPGPVDLPVDSSGRWSLDGDRLVLRGEDGGTRHEWTVAVAAGDRLRLKRPESG